MKISSTRRGALLSALLSPLLLLISGRATEASPTRPVRRWRKLAPGDVFRAGDVGCEINPATAAGLLLYGGASGEGFYVRPASSWMVGIRLETLSSPDPSKFFWWRTETFENAPPEKILWKSLGEEPLELGDFFCTCDPNGIELHGKGGGWGHNIQLQAAHPMCFGTPANRVPVGSGGFWRPVGFA